MYLNGEFACSRRALGRRGWWVVPWGTTKDQLGPPNQGKTQIGIKIGLRGSNWGKTRLRKLVCSPTLLLNRILTTSVTSAISPRVVKASVRDKTTRWYLRIWRPRPNTYYFCNISDLSLCCKNQRKEGKQRDDIYTSEDPDRIITTSATSTISPRVVKKQREESKKTRWYLRSWRPEPNTYYILL